MTEHEPGNDGTPGIGPDSGTTDPEHRAAHERLATGGLARWARACSTHPWRVVGAWVGIIATLIVLVSTVGGSLRDEFEIPGSDTQRATDLIEKEFSSEQGGVLNIVFAAPAGQRLDTPARKAAILKAIKQLRRRSSSPSATRPASRASPIRSTRTPSPRAAASRTRRHSSTRRSRTRTAAPSSPSRITPAKPSRRRA